MTRRAILRVEVDLDNIPGAFHAADDARAQVERILGDAIPHYHPTVALERMEVAVGIDVDQLVRDRAHKLTDEDRAELDAQVPDDYPYTCDLVDCNERAPREPQPGCPTLSVLCDKHAAEIHAKKVHEALATLDGTEESRIALATGLTREEIEDLGGLG